jgi:hypothetical protein
VRAPPLAACLCAALLAAACDESFEPRAPSDLAFSVFGYLDASADTQWIRVMPLRPLKLTPPDTVHATVTLEQLGTGRIIAFRDSLFKFSSYSDSAIGSEGTYVHNFWTRERIEPGAAYRFLATREGEEPAEAVVEIPRDFGVEVEIKQSSDWPWETDQLQITGLKHLPFLTAVAYFYDDCGGSVSGEGYTGQSADDGAYLIAITKPLVTPRTGCGAPLVEKRELRIVGSEAEWPAGQGYSPGGLGESGRVSNVTNAVGFLGGVLTRVIPYEDCRFRSEGASDPRYCRLRYGPETATVTGIVSETRCRDGALDSVTVQLTEMGREPPRIRTALSTRAGEFSIGALEPGIPHFLWVRAPPIPSDSMFDVYSFRYVYTKWVDVHTLHTDTLTFVPGQRLEYDIGLERLTPCSQPPPARR